MSGTPFKMKGSPYARKKLGVKDKAKILLKAAKANISAKRGFISGTIASYKGMKKEQRTT